jgi:hypothetical protein
MRKAVAFWCTALAGLACSAAPADTGFPVAYWHDDCAPWDGHALTIILTHTAMQDPFEATYPHLRITSYRPPTSLAGASLAWSGTAQDDGYAVLCESEGVCHVAGSVRLRFDGRQDAVDPLRGDVRVQLQVGGEIAGPFEARPLPFGALCG